MANKNTNALFILYFCNQIFSHLKNVMLLILVLITLLELIGRLMTDAWWLNITKPLLMPILMIYLTVCLPFHFEGRLFIYLALIFSTLGDVFLMFSEQIMFLMGVGLFALAHLFYILFFIRHKTPLNGSLKPMLLISLSIYGVLLIYSVFSHLGDFKPFVIGYALIITVMLYTSFFVKGRFSKKAFQTIIAGAALFVISDSLLALNMFGHAFKNAGFWVMLTYILAQFFIIQGVIFQYDKQAINLKTMP